MKEDGGGRCPGWHGQGSVSLGEWTNFVSDVFGCKLGFHPPEGALHQVGWPERECWSWQLYHPYWQEVICSL